MRNTEGWRGMEVKIGEFGGRGKMEGYRRGEMEGKMGEGEN